MGGAGLGLRFRPTLRFALDADLDFVGGTDYSGDGRRETAFTLTGLFYLNPRSAVEVYLLAGLGWSGARVTCDVGSVGCPGGTTQDYGYFGGQAGGGIELRLSPVLALYSDLRGFVRGRTDAMAASQPEFVSADGRATNTSGGALLTAGTTLYF